MATKFPGWLSAAEAVAQYGINYDTLRDLVQEGVFTRGSFAAGRSRPRIYVREVELKAWKSGGVGAVAPVRAALQNGQHDEPLVNALDTEGR